MVKSTSTVKMADRKQRRGLQPDPAALGASAGASASDPLTLSAAELHVLSPSPSSSMAQAKARVSLAQAVPGLGLLGIEVLRPVSRGEGRVKTQAGAAQKVDPLSPRKVPVLSLTNTVTLPLRTTRGQNDREHPMARHRRVKSEKAAVAWMLVHAFGSRNPHAVPLLVRLTRGAPGNGLDDDNLVGSLKAVRDSVAAYVGIDDRHTQWVRYAYAQQRSNRQWWVRIEFVPIPTITDEVQP